MKKILKNILPYLIIVVVVILIRLFIATPVQVVGSSMYPTLNNNEILLLNKLVNINKSYKRFDIIVIKYNSETIIKRIIGLPGEKIEYIDNVLYVNGEIVNESFEHDVTDDFNIQELGEDTIPDNTYLVLGDNRGISKDSRLIGFIDEKNIIGKSSIRLLPINKIGFIN